MQGGSFCERSACDYSGDTLKVECVMCGTCVFCSEKCKTLGMIDHVKSGCDQKEIYTPRSVLNNLVYEIEKSGEALKTLQEKYILDKKQKDWVSYY